MAGKELTMTIRLQKGYGTHRSREERSCSWVLTTCKLNILLIEGSGQFLLRMAIHRNWPLPPILHKVIEIVPYEVLYFRCCHSLPSLNLCMVGLVIKPTCNNKCTYCPNDTTDLCLIAQKPRQPEAISENKETRQWRLLSYWRPYESNRSTTLLKRQPSVATLFFLFLNLLSRTLPPLSLGSLTKGKD